MLTTLHLFIMGLHGVFVKMVSISGENFDFKLWVA